MLKNNLEVMINEKSFVFVLTNYYCHLKHLKKKKTENIMSLISKYIISGEITSFIFDVKRIRDIIKL